VACFINTYSSNCKFIISSKNKIMKNLILTLFAIVALIHHSCAQWTTSGCNIYNSNTGDVGIGTGTTLTPATQLDVYQAISNAHSATFTNVGISVSGGNPTTLSIQ
jgi:hypothetical protein